MMKLVMIDLKNSLTDKKNKLIINIKYFFATYVVSLLLYQFFINNLLMNTEDTMGTPTFYMGGAHNVSLGRYLYAVLQLVFMGINAEPINTASAILIICLSVFLIFSLFEDGRLLFFVATLMVISSPITYYIMSHRYSSIAASLQVFFSVLSVYGVIKYKHFITKLIFSTILLVISLALVQYGIGIAALVMLFYCIYIYVFKNEKIKDVIKLICHFIIVLILALLLYRVSWSVCMKLCKVSSTSYFGASDIGILSIITMFPSSFIKTYSIMLDYLNGNIIKFNIFGAYIINYIFIIFTLISIFIYTYKKFKSVLTAILVDLALIIFIPPILSITIFFTPSYQYIRPHQMITFALFIPMTIMLLKKIFYTDVSYIKLVKVLKPLYLILAMVLFHSQILQMSVDFDTMYRSKNAMQNISMLILNKLENKNLLDSKKNYYIYGNFFDNELYYIQDYKDRYTKLDKVNYRFAVGNVSSNDWWGQFLKTEFIREYMGINLFPDTPHEKYNSYYDTEEFKRIKPFPADESIFGVSETDVIIKVSD